jgi:hypothetical protein
MDVMASIEEAFVVPFQYMYIINVGEIAREL